MPDLRTVLIVSPYFPPSALAGVHRARLLAKYLPAAGWRPIVLCVDEAFHEQKLDPDLARLVPSTVKIVKVPALPLRFVRPFGVGVGDIGLRALGQLRSALFRLLSKRQIDTVLITGSPFFPMLLASHVRRRFGVPVILDFQDPWVSAWGAEQPVASKAGLVHRLAVTLEPRALRGADYVTCVSEVQSKMMAARHPWLDTARMAAVPIGGDPEDFHFLREHGAEQCAHLLEGGAINFSFVGTFMPRSGPLMRQLLRALRLLKVEEPRVAARIRLNFVGTSNQSNDTQRYSVMPLAEEEGVADNVREIPQRIPYLKALSILAHSDGILLIGSDEPHYTASKIYPALMSGRPFLSLYHRASSSHQILSSAGGGIALSFDDGKDLQSLAPAIAQALHTLAVVPDQLGRADPSAYAPYEARAVAQRFADLFRKASS
jgi:hypothetical protein